MPKNPKNCIFCEHMAQLTRVNDGTVLAFVCTNGDVRVLDETPKPQWCPLDEVSTEAEENHNYMHACERGKLDV